MIIALVALLAQPTSETVPAQPTRVEIPIDVVEAIAALPGPDGRTGGRSADFAQRTADMLFDPEQDAMTGVDWALAEARTSGKHVLIVYGGAWCHDSVALIDAMFAERFLDRLTDRYALAFVNVPFDRSERTIAAASRFGLGDIEGTPTVLILRADGTPVNLEDAPRWRNAASRKPAAIHRALERAVPAIVP